MNKLSFQQKLWVPLICSLLCITAIFIYQTIQMRDVRIEERQIDLMNLDDAGMHWNAVALWQALAADAEPPQVEQSANATHWLVWRQGEQPHFRSLAAAEAEALYRIAEGASFGEVCAAAGEEATLALAGYLQHWLAQGVLLRH